MRRCISSFIREKIRESPEFAEVWAIDYPEENYLRAGSNSRGDGLMNVSSKSIIGGNSPVDVKSILKDHFESPPSFLNEGNKIAHLSSSAGRTAERGDRDTQGEGFLRDCIGSWCSYY
jgi:hypothetical protein